MQTAPRVAKAIATTLVLLLVYQVVPTQVAMEQMRDLLEESHHDR